MFRFTARQKAVGLFQSNFSVYWSARRAGSCHEDALAAVAGDRVLHSFGEAPALMSPAAPRSEQEAAELKTLVWLIFCNESGEPRTAAARKKLLQSMEECFAVVEVRARLAAIGQTTTGG